MCGVLGLVAHEPVNQLLYDGLQMLQHRGQDAAGIVTVEYPYCFWQMKSKNWQYMPEQRKNGRDRMWRQFSLNCRRFRFLL